MEKTEYWKKLYERNIQIAAYLDQGHNIEFIMQKFNLSRTQAYHLASLYRRSGNGIKALVPGSRVPIRSHRSDPIISDLACALRSGQGLSADRIWEHLHAHAQKLSIKPEEIPTPRTLHRILKREQKIEPKQKYKPKPIVDYYSTRHAGYPNHIIEADLKCDHFLLEQRVNFFGHLEQFSRSVVGSIAKEQTAENCCANLLDYIYQRGIPSVAKNDNGGIYIGQANGPAFGLYTKLCLYLGIEQIFIPFEEPRWNVFIERFFRTWDDEFFNKERFTSWSGFVRKNQTYLQYYNRYRKHQAIGKLTPDNCFTENLPQPRFPKLKQEKLCRSIEQRDLPLKAGRVSFIRRVQADGTIRIKNHTYRIGKALINKYVKATVFIQTGTRQFDVYFWYKDTQFSKNKYRI